MVGWFTSLDHCEGRREKEFFLCSMYYVEVRQIIRINLYINIYTPMYTYVHVCVCIHKNVYIHIYEIGVDVAEQSNCSKRENSFLLKDIHDMSL